MAHVGMNIICMAQTPGYIPQKMHIIGILKTKLLALENIACHYVLL